LPLLPYSWCCDLLMHLFYLSLLIVANLSTASNSAETPPDPTNDRALRLGLTIGLPVALGAVALAVMTAALVLWFRRRRDKKDEKTTSKRDEKPTTKRDKSPTSNGDKKPKSKEEGRPRQSLAFYQAVRAVRPASLAMYRNSEHHLPPVEDGHSPRSIDKQGHSLNYNSSGYNSPRSTHQGITFSRNFYWSPYSISN